MTLIPVEGAAEVVLAVVAAGLAEAGEGQANRPDWSVHSGSSDPGQEPAA